MTRSHWALLILTLGLLIAIGLVASASVGANRHAPPPPPNRYESLGQTRWGNDPDDVLSIVCDHESGTVIYLNQRGGVSTKTASEARLSCPVISGPLTPNQLGGN